ncbi:hypothetical protein C0995_016649 [Termitomyces sp. Mi166|nr:hypothetical protein C0995_016649 [Termitomyces sp. Mi166\
MQKKDGQVAKFMPHFDGPYSVIHSFLETSTYELDISMVLAKCKTFHAVLLKLFYENNNELFPSQHLAMPEPIVTDEGEEEFFVDWNGYGPESDLWCLAHEMEETIVLDEWEVHKKELESQRRGDGRV